MRTDDPRSADGAAGPEAAAEPRGVAGPDSSADPAGPRILVVDNYDSFVFTIVGYLEQMGADCTVRRHDHADLDPTEFDGVLISPGPGNPDTAGRSLEVIEACARTGTPMLGVCLGLQALAQLFGATVAHAPNLMHGRTCAITHEGRSVFEGLASPLTATRYHSLAVVPETLPVCLEVTASAEDGSIQGIAHRELPLHAVQFHPESVLTEGGHHMLAVFLQLAEGAPTADAARRAEGLRPLIG
ncbi:gamma-glutamyl-gamma-aminobutyrate hydrolase family protein [Helcobacillus massiliensis]|uniref:anthranilate synthase component II n=1 Tax=Helcobacillus massiliensis TaxID=521392 RepID=UPI0021A2B28C|nr:gamma-glutamyl-gamma-aminobutyrate hydrolase family protein [Helcobacillus massiliensis]MCT1556687.1 gamma-glutamyl-gamma-aminobutyrate hydrolase family protein [Helcobacillus massiliensis]MCT2035881.1 gamma-glutamyl-gamma-aminobutyrate hydrolase family protein [Helcobacillus massiliensis]MCT2331037.1 gamma-glutamyl-gamma-aminobutyrate hydrolase family protein [Helcobacillus massiliensis]